MSPGDGQDLPGPLGQEAQRDGMAEFAGYVVNCLFSVALSLESARRIVGDGPAGDRIAAATGDLDRLIRDIRTRLFNPAAERSAVLTAQMARAARELQVAAERTAALLEQRANIAKQPSQMDYPAEIKRWRVFARQAEQMARRWEQPP